MNKARKARNACNNTVVNMQEALGRAASEDISAGV